MQYYVGMLHNKNQCLISSPHVCRFLTPSPSVQQSTTSYWTFVPHIPKINAAWRRIPQHQTHQAFYLNYRHRFGCIFTDVVSHLAALPVSIHLGPSVLGDTSPRLVEAKAATNLPVPGSAPPFIIDSNICPSGGRGRRELLKSFFLAAAGRWKRSVEHRARTESKSQMQL